MDRPPVDHGSDRYDYVELIGAPPGVAPRGEWWDRLIAEPCPDCRANVFAYWDDERALGKTARPWRIEIAHDDGCPELKRQESH